MRVLFDGEEKVEAVAGGMAMEVITDGDESPPHRLDHRDERVDVSSSSVLYPVCSMMLLLPLRSISCIHFRRRLFYFWIFDREEAPTFLLQFPVRLI